MSHDDNSNAVDTQQQNDHQNLPTTTITNDENNNFESVTTLNNNSLDSNQNFSYSDNTKSDILGLFDDDDDEEDDDYQDLNEDEDIELENFDWIDWDDMILPDDEFDGSSSQAKRGRKKYQKFEKPSVLPSIRPKSPTKQTTASSNSVNMLNNVQIPSQPYQFPFPQIMAPQLFPQSGATKNFNQFPIVPSTIFPTYDLMFSRGVNLPNASTSSNVVASSSNASVPTQSSPSSPPSSSNNSISSIFSSQSVISDEQMKELQYQIQTHTQLLFYNYFLSSFNQELKELNKKFKNLITSYLVIKKEAVNNKMRKLLYLFNVSKDVKIVNLLDGSKKVTLTENSFTPNERNEERNVEEWIELLTTSILDVEGIDSMDIFIDFDYSFFYINNQINWELFVKFLKPFKLFSNQSLLAEIQESIYYLNTTAERGIGSKRMVFTIPEDNLLLIGLKKHWKPGTTIKWERIRDEFVPNKSSKQLRVRYKNMIGKRAASLEFNPFKTFRTIAEETNQQHEGSGSTKKKDDSQVDYSYLFESIKLFKITSKLTRKEIPVSYKDLSKIHTYVPRDNISESESDLDQTKDTGEKKRKKNEKINPKKKKKQDTEDITSLENNLLTTEKIDQIVAVQPQVEIPPIIENPIIEQPINPLNESSLSEVFLKPDLELSTSKILPFEDVGSIDSSSDEEDNVHHVEKDSEIIHDGIVHKFTYEDDRHILVTLQTKGLQIGTLIVGDEFDSVLLDIAKELSRSKQVIKARYNKIISINKK
ncbi:predicted protein [Naegleria gruberi]|uniref:Predicted protein n=1 Tax=Naegleria gruberi TaxID=5762 RepID=D2V9W4_NAEGR|nr:uncharacterized protein NAEGRDRAFT_47823 [Naegleria gruberi]EFC46210.1 predicted protein [Naegleria gruberi]|eukprot:XP_002678954.1 predicted protein [Naegleria gruberi strain NEG-M]